MALVLLLFSCEESVDGCLDIRASNFDVMAVTACDSCCTFPTGSLDIDFRFDTLPLSFNNDFLLGEDSIQLRSLELPFSQFSLMRLGETFNFIDTILRFTPTMRDDYVLIERANSQTIGRTDFVTQIDSINARVGLDIDELDMLRPFIDVSNGNNVNFLISNMYVDSLDIFVQARMEVEIADSVRSLEILSISNPTIAFADTVNIMQGQNWSIDWDLDVKVLLQGISPNDTNESMAEKISQNIAESISPR